MVGLRLNSLKSSDVRQRKKFGEPEVKSERGRRRLREDVLEE